MNRDIKNIRLPARTKAFLMASVAVSALTMSGAVHAQQATADFDLGTLASPAYNTPVSSADVGSILAQQNTAAVAGSTTGTTVNLSLTSSSVGDVTYAGAYNETANLFATIASGNTTDSSVVFGPSPSSSGDTAIAGSYQTNIAASADVTATTTGTHTATIENSDTSSEAILTGTLLVDGNDATSSATANNANSAITLSSGVDILEDATAAQASVVSDTTVPTGVDSDNSADILVSSGQVASGAMSVIASTTNGDIDVTVETVNGATITISDSDITASAQGNTSVGAITSSDTAATITASTAVSNMQLLDIDTNDFVRAEVQSSVITLEVGRDPAGDEDGSIDNSNLRITSNTFSATAEGNDSSQTISLVANTLTGSGTANSSDTATGSGVQLAATADAVVANTQVSSATAVQADTEDSGILLEFNSDQGDHDNNALVVTNNTISATARGADTTNSLSLQGTATMSATGAVANVQADSSGSISANVDDSSISIVSDDSSEDFDGGTITLSSNAITASATGARANNDLTVAVGTNTLSLETNTGDVTIAANPSAAASSPTAIAGFVLTNEQDKSGGSVTATIDDESDINVSLLNDSYDIDDSTVNIDSNTLSSQAVGATADNLMTLNFNTLAGTLATNGDAVAITANNQTLSGSATITARTVDDNDGKIIHFNLADETFGSNTITASSNTVSAVAMGNQTTNNDIVVNATNIDITGGVDAGSSTVLSTGTLTANGAFVAASVQEIDSVTLLATQNEAAGSNLSNLIILEVDQPEEPSTIVADSNVLSVLAIGNTAANAVAVGTSTTTTIEASSASANVQLIRTGDIDGVIGVLGSDAELPYSSLNGGTNTTVGTIADPATTTASNTYQNNSGSPLTLQLNSPLTSQEVTILTNAGFTGATLGGTTATWPNGVAIDLSIFNLTFVAGGGGDNSGDENIIIAGFTFGGTAAVLNNAGVIISTDDGIDDSSLSVTNNAIAGEARGNVATNATSVEATTVTETSTATATTTLSATTLAPTNASTVVTNVQNVDNASDLDMAVAGAFAIHSEGDDSGVDDSQLNVDNNLQQSYATANRATNAITITATNSTADGVIENEQSANATVSTTSDLDLMSIFGIDDSTTSIDSNRNESVASGNIAFSTFTVVATNQDGANSSSTDASVNKSTEVVVGDAIVASDQSTNAAITASATSDAFNEGISFSSPSNIDASTVSISSNVTIAQATANTSTLTGALGTALTANYDASGALSSLQDFSAAVNSTTDVEITLSLNTSSSSDENVLNSTVNLNANQGSAVARGNVVVTNLSVDGTNIDGGTGANDSVLNGAFGTNTAAFVASSDQSTASGLVSSDSSSMTVLLDLTSSTTQDTDATLKTSTVTLSSNRSESTATSNNADNTLTLGSAGSTSALSATGGVLNGQIINGSGSLTTATGGMTVTADIDTSGTTTSPNTVNAVAGSQLSLASNVSTATATGNTADNTLTAISTQITAGTASDANANSNTPLADAGFSLLNQQGVSNVAGINLTSTNTANTVSALLTAEDTAVATSTVTLTGNSFSAATYANDAENTMTLGAAGTTANLSSTGAVVSEQQTNTVVALATAGGTVTVDIDSTDIAETAMTGSTLSVSGNSSLASTTLNNALNSLTAISTNITAGAANTDAQISGTDIDGAYAISNLQTTIAGSATATNTANNFTIDVDSADNGVGTSTISLSSNTVNAQATGNIAVNNSLGLGGSGTAAITATGGIASSQTNGATVAANADSTVTVNVDSSDTTVNAVSGSTVNLQNNVTRALARGNVALNAMTVTSAAATGGDADGAGLSSVGILTATYGILNAQTNTAGVTATIAGTTYSVALNGGAPAAALAASGSTFAVSGNVAEAIAYGNVGTNNITLASLNGSADDASVMAASIQSNTGTITARLSGSSATFAADGAVSSSTVGVSGNAFRATAVGNYATSVVTRN